jgi:RNA polymerase sigma factor (sigma-70 family)
MLLASPVRALVDSRLAPSFPASPRFPGQRCAGSRLGYATAQKESSMTAIQSWESLKEGYLAALDAGKDWLDLWRLFVEHPWYQEQLQSIAAQLVRHSHNARVAVEDVKHDAMLLLAKNLQSCPDMHLDREQAELRFGGWMATIIRRGCQQVLRSDRRPRPEPSEMVSDDVAPGESTDLESRIDLSLALEQLPDRIRAVTILSFQGWQPPEIAAELGQSYWMTIRQLHEGRRLMARKLRDCG